MPKITQPRKPIALDARVGDYLEKQVPNGPDHIITSTEPVMGGIRICTNQNPDGWVFHKYEQLRFPRRPDGSERNWFEDGVSPYPTDLAIGDTLPPAEPDPSLDDQWKDAPQQIRDNVRASWLRSEEVVIAIKPYINNPTIAWTVTMKNMGTGYPTNRNFLLSEKIEPPYPVARRIVPKGVSARPEPDPEAEWRAYGPYRDPEGDIVFLAEHRHGRGRWNPELATTKSKWVINDELMIRRPPGYAKEYWEGWAYLGDGLRGSTGRHPRDSKRKANIDSDFSRDVAQVHLDAYYAWCGGEVKYDGDDEGARELRERMNHGPVIETRSTRDLVRQALDERTED